MLFLWLSAFQASTIQWTFAYSKQGTTFSKGMVRSEHDHGDKKAKKTFFPSWFSILAEIHFDNLLCM
jgi:hypothetical protein